MIVLPDPALAPAIVAAVKGSVGDQGVDPIQKSAMEAIAHDILRLDVDIELLEPLSPSQAAVAIEDPQIRLQVLQGMLALEMLQPASMDDTETDEAKRRVSVAQADRIEGYSKAFGVKLSQLATFRDRAEGHVRMMYVDMFGRTELRRAAIDTIQHSGLQNFVRNIVAMRGYGTVDAVADKYRRLEDLPDGTWGKQLVVMYQKNGWPYPGESHGVPEPTAIHDWVHVVSGYPPSSVGEVQVNAFMHATSPDPSSFGTVVLALSLYGLGGISLPIGNFTSKGADLAREDIGALYSEAVNRSIATRTDFMMGIDHWGNAAKPVEQIRHQYGVGAKTVDIGEGDPGLPNYEPT